MMTTKEEKRELLHRKWEEQIAECESNNMPVKEWCAENGVNLNTFYARISSLKKDKLKQSVQQTQEIVPCIDSEHIFSKVTANQTRPFR